MSPRAFVVVGPAGSGKSTLAAELAARLRAGHLDKDTMFAAFVEAMLTAAGEDPHGREASGFYRTQVMPLEYQSLFRCAADCLRAGTDVVIDAPFAGLLDQPRYLATRRAEAGWPPEAEVILARVIVPPDVVRARLTARGLDRDQAKLADWDNFWSTHGDPRCTWEGLTATVDAATLLQPSPDGR
ncbi:ATP-binding protein [Actinoplanes bogorensis]|uniref:ATP-binding protein n=1 Tax=Paractinoplanes bogorensis TaxID=1610840 RepID=A0ABS5Z3B4_9ACTN|nr:AAA family ATPase [Actinoplanes bogorensis]MBU2670192.1 ATP-binding protein [Actinoplanes bogorensis]